MGGFVRGARAFSVCLALLLVASFAQAISRADFDGVVDFSVTLKTLAAAADGQATLPPNKMFILDGTVADVIFIDKEQASFGVRVELLSGEWIGLDDVESYTCYVTFSGSQFFRVFPSRTPEGSATDVVLLNSRVLVVARAVGTILSPEGEKRILLEGVLVRTLQ